MDKASDDFYCEARGVSGQRCTYFSKIGMLDGKRQLCRYHVEIEAGLYMEYSIWRPGELMAMWRVATGRAQLAKLRICPTCGGTGRA